MLGPGSLCFLDTMVIIECFRLNVWSGLANHYSFESVEKVVEETQTGFLNRRDCETPNYDQVRKGFHRIVEPPKRDIAQLQLSYPSAATIDDGEKMLLSHIQARMEGEKEFFICCSDKAAIRTIHEMNILDSLVSLEELIEKAGLRLREPLRRNHTRMWLEGFRTDLRLE